MNQQSNLPPPCPALGSQEQRLPLPLLPDVETETEAERLFLQSITPESFKAFAENLRSLEMVNHPASTLQGHMSGLNAFGLNPEPALPQHLTSTIDSIQQALNAWASAIMWDDVGLGDLTSTLIPQLSPDPSQQDMFVVSRIPNGTVNADQALAHQQALEEKPKSLTLSNPKLDSNSGGLISHTGFNYGPSVVVSRTRALSSTTGSVDVQPLPTPLTPHLDTLEVLSDWVGSLRTTPTGDGGRDGDARQTPDDVERYNQLSGSKGHESKRVDASTSAAPSNNRGSSPERGRSWSHHVAEVENLAKIALTAAVGTVKNLGSLTSSHTGTPTHEKWLKGNGGGSKAAGDPVKPPPMPKTPSYPAAVLSKSPKPSFEAPQNYPAFPWTANMLYNGYAYQPNHHEPHQFPYQTPTPTTSSPFPYHPPYYGGGTPNQNHYSGYPYNGNTYWQRPFRNYNMPMPISPSRTETVPPADRGSSDSRATRPSVIGRKRSLDNVPDGGTDEELEESQMKRQGEVVEKARLVDVDKRNRNSEAARKSRAKKTKRIEDLEILVKEYEGRQSSMDMRAACLNSENVNLRKREKELVMRIEGLELMIREMCAAAGTKLKIVKEDVDRMKIQDPMEEIYHYQDHLNGRGTVVDGSFGSVGDGSRVAGTSAPTRYSAGRMVNQPDTHISMGFEKPVGEPPYLDHDDFVDHGWMDQLPRARQSYFAAALGGKLKLVQDQTSLLSRLPNYNQNMADQRGYYPGTTFSLAPSFSPASKCNGRIFGLEGADIECGTITSQKSAPPLNCEVDLTQISVGCGGGGVWRSREDPRRQECVTKVALQPYGDGWENMECGDGIEAADLHGADVRDLQDGRMNRRRNESGLEVMVATGIVPFAGSSGSAVNEKEGLVMTGSNEQHLGLAAKIGKPLLYATDSAFGSTRDAAAQTAMLPTPVSPVKDDLDMLEADFGNDAAVRSVVASLDAGLDAISLESKDQPAPGHVGGSVDHAEFSTAAGFPTKKLAKPALNHAGTVQRRQRSDGKGQSKSNLLPASPLFAGPPLRPNTCEPSTEPRPQRTYRLSHPILHPFSWPTQSPNNPCPDFHTSQPPWYGRTSFPIQDQCMVSGSPIGWTDQPMRSPPLKRGDPVVFLGAFRWDEGEHLSRLQSPEPLHLLDHLTDPASVSHVAASAHGTKMGEAVLKEDEKCHEAPEDQRGKKRARLSEEDKRSRNCEAAKRSRAKKNVKIENLEQQLKNLEDRQIKMAIRSACLDSENCGLREREKELLDRIAGLESTLRDMYRVAGLTIESRDCDHKNIFAKEQERLLEPRCDKKSGDAQGDAITKDSETHK
ncbi:hypothetical protein HDU97_009404 [Phlyctochytrium planicorne]|nr:hypothetical protein HDU97_009404 [Phlyctochytrium planicorne]